MIIILHFLIVLKNDRFYNFTIGDDMKSKIMSVLQLILSIAVIVLLNMFYFRILGIFHLKFSGDEYLIANTIKYLLMSMIIFIIYHKEIKSGKNKFNRQLLNSVIYSVACFVFLVVITIVIREALKYFGHDPMYHFTNYFNQSFTLNFVLSFIINCIFIPFLLCIVFPLGFSNIFRKHLTASFTSGICYGIYYGIMLKTSFDVAIYAALTPAVIVGLLTYLYKTNKNIWSVIITYISYVLLGVFVVQYFM